MFFLVFLPYHRTYPSSQSYSETKNYSKTKQKNFPSLMCYNRKTTRTRLSVDLVTTTSSLSLLYVWLQEGTPSVYTVFSRETPSIIMS